MNSKSASLAFWLAVTALLALNPAAFPAGHMSVAALLAVCAVSAVRGGANGVLLAVIFSFSYFAFHPVSGIFHFVMNLVFLTLSAVAASFAVNAGKKSAEKKSGEEKEFSSKVISAFMTSHEMLWQITGEEKKERILAAFTRAAQEITGADFIAIYERAGEETHYHPVFTSGKTEYTIIRKVEASSLNNSGKGCIVPLDAKGSCCVIKPGKYTMSSFFVFIHSAGDFKESDIYISELLLAQSCVLVEKQAQSEKQKETMLRIIEALAIAIDTKDHGTYGHSMMTMEYATRLAEKMGMTETEKENIRHACLLHDLGKVSISPSILNKPGKLTTEEFEYIKKHPMEGVNILGRLNIFREIIPIVLYHHERFDGNGYPCSLKGEEIPIGARICAIADAYSVMLTERVYKRAMTPDEAREELKRCAGSQFDAGLVDVFLETMEAQSERERHKGLN